MKMDDKYKEIIHYPNIVILSVLHNTLLLFSPSYEGSVGQVTLFTLSSVSNPDGKSLKA